MIPSSVQRERKTLQEPFAWRDGTHVASNRLDDDAGDITLILSDEGLGLMAGCYTGGQGVFSEIAGDTGESGTPKVAAPEPAFTNSESAWP